MDGLEIQYHFGNAKTFWTWLSSEKFFWSSPKRFGISKMKLDIQKIDCERRSLGRQTFFISCFFGNVFQSCFCNKFGVFFET